MAALPNNNNLIASGEIGKTPAIYLYAYSPNTNSGAPKNNNAMFRSLGCMKGFHTRGVAQLCFNAAGTVLFSVGVDYTVAMYCTDSANTKQLCKLIYSSQGPKDKVLHACYCGDGSGPNSTVFVTCGEKHVTVWRVDKGSLKQETGKLGTFKNKFIMSAAQLGT